MQPVIGAGGEPDDLRMTTYATLSGTELVVTRQEIRCKGVTSTDMSELGYARQP